MQNLVKHTLKIVSYSAFVMAGLVATGFWHSAGDKKGYTVTRRNEQLKDALLVGIAHADVPMCGAYVCGAGGDAGGGGDGGGDCGDGGGGDDCN